LVSVDPQVVAVAAGPPHAGPQAVVLLDAHQPQVLRGQFLPLGNETALVGVDLEVVAVRSMLPDA
jgi:hypothetical protein